MIHFPRPRLVAEIVDGLRGKAIFGDAHNGLFLAAPRRTGKTTFLRSDLSPELEKQGVAVVYVDLWADKRRDPGELVSSAVAKSLTAHLGVIGRTAKGAGLESVTLGGVLKFDASKIGRLDGMTLTDALGALREAADRPVALIVDEAQHALTSEAGEVAMSGLKAARDHLNRPGEVNLMLVMSGSDRDKLLRLVNAQGAPFFGSQITRMPMLDADFIAHIARLIQVQRPDLPGTDTRKLLEAFEGFGHRPQFFMEALGQALSPLSSAQGVRFEEVVLEAAIHRRRRDESQMASEYLALRPIEQAVLWRLLEQGRDFRPYDAEALKFYREREPGGRVDAQKVQRALESLRARTPALIWKSARGEYAVDDAAMHRWFQEQLAAGAWPPVDPQGPLSFDEDGEP